MLKVKVLARILNILNSFTKVVDKKKFEAKVQARYALNDKVKAAAKNIVTINEECKQDALNLEMALTEEIAALEQRYDLKHQAVEQKFEDAKAAQFRLEKQHKVLNDL